MLLLATVGLPPTAGAIDLTAAYDAAARHDTQVESARKELAAATERRAQADAALRPTLGTAAAANIARADNNVLEAQNFNWGTAALNLNVPVYRPVFGAAAEQAAIAERFARAQLDQAEQDLATRAAQAYFDALAADDAVAVAEAQRTAIAEQFAAAKRNFEVGTTTITDQQEAQARLDLNEALLAAARNDLTVRIASLRSLTGTEPLPLFPLRRDATLPRNMAMDLETFSRSARDENYMVRQAWLAAEAARKQVAEAKYGHYPTVDIVSQAGMTRGRTPTIANVLVNRRTEVNAGLQFSVPLYAGGAIDAREREAIALLAKSEADLESVRRQTEQAAREVYLGLNSNLEQVGALEAAVRSSRLALESNLLGYQVGVRINVDVLNAQQQWFTTQRDLSRARYDVLVNTLRLKAAAGALQGVDIAAINSLLIAPDRQSREVDVPTISGPRTRPDSSRSRGPSGQGAGQRGPQGGAGRGQSGGQGGIQGSGQSDTQDSTGSRGSSAPASGEPPSVEPREFGGVVTKPLPPPALTPRRPAPPPR
ncbi:MAG: TolC family outer membrane protein [Burkholderiaceae bacterium]